VSVPSHRATKDITIEEDLMEEVGRMYRFDNIPEQPLVSIVRPPPREEELFLQRRAVEVAALQLGCHEVYNYTCVPDAVLAAAGVLDQEYLRVDNPVAPDVSRVRRHVLPSLLASVRANLRHTAEVRLCEQGKGYRPEMRDADRMPHEVWELAFAFCRREGKDPYGELREGVQHLLRRLGYPVTLNRLWNGKDQPFVHPGRTAALERDGSPVGFVGALHPAAVRGFELPASTAIACIDVRALRATGRKTAGYVPIPTFPVLPVDVALLVEAATTVATAAEFLQRVGKKLVRSVELFEVYRGEGLGAGQKSLNFTVTLGADDRTLDAADEARYLARVREQASEIGAQLRG
jgi:phenylalanyl-tRNA synthetase beta chain